MPLDPNVRNLLDQMEAIGAPPLHTLSEADARAAMDAMVMMMGQGETVASTEDRTVDLGDRQLPVRIYRPEGLADGPAPTLVFYHGGGFVIGGLASHDGDCRALANRGLCQVIAVDYRLAPEHPFPAAAQDAIDALDHIVAHAAELGVDPAHVAVGGDSAGGNLSAVAALHARDVGIDLKLQLLIYPAVAGEGDYPSRTENATGYMLDEDSIAYFTTRYFPGGLPEGDWRAAPMEAASHERVAPALIITAEFDPLRDEGEAYARKLEAAGVVATATRYDGLIHGFFGMGALVPAAKAAVEEAGQALREALHD
ncbi:MAG: alpha/beta hydrolase [Ilumatobacteraceae bacterium]